MKKLESFDARMHFYELLRLTSSQPRESVDSTIYCNANEFLHTIVFAGYRVLFV